MHLGICAQALAPPKISRIISSKISGDKFLHRANVGIYSRIDATIVSPRNYSDENVKISIVGLKWVSQYHGTSAVALTGVSSVGTVGADHSQRYHIAEVQLATDAVRDVFHGGMAQLRRLHSLVTCGAQSEDPELLTHLILFSFGHADRSDAGDGSVQNKDHVVIVQRPPVKSRMYYLSFNVKNSA